MFYNIFNSHIAFLGLSGGWDLAFGMVLLPPVSRNKWDCWLFDQPFCLFGLCPGNLGKSPLRTGALVNLFPLFPISGKRRGMWPTNTGLDLRIWSSASPALWHSQPWSAAPMATPTHPRSVTFVFFDINNTPCLLILTSLSVQTGTAVWISVDFGPCPGEAATWADSLTKETSEIKYYLPCPGVIKGWGERVSLRVACDPEVNLGELPGEGEVAGCSKDVSHTARLMGSKAWGGPGCCLAVMWRRKEYDVSTRSSYICCTSSLLALRRSLGLQGASRSYSLMGVQVWCQVILTQTYEKKMAS